MILNSIFLPASTGLAKSAGKVISRLRVHSKSDIDDVIDDDLILIWSSERRVITGADILGRLLRGIALRDLAPIRTT